MAEAQEAGEPIRRTLLGGEEFARAYGSWAAAIAAAMATPDPWAIIGIKRRGTILARRLRDLIGEERARTGGPDVAFGEVDISLYRDDYHLKTSQSRVLGTEIPFAVDGRRILLVDDVLFTGRTVRAAIDQILDFGRPPRILLAVFIDRGHRELPIAPDFVARRIETSPGDRVAVWYRETEGEDRVDLIEAR
jgi:pyrimidine operon attenuation protein/uracil phosphoribosyltransferase